MQNFGKRQENILIFLFCNHVSDETSLWNAKGDKRLKKKKNIGCTTEYVA